MVKVLSYSTISVDGGLDRVHGKIVLSSDRDFYRLHVMRASVDAVMVGANTVMKDDPLLTVRLPEYSGRQPYRVVVDAKLKLDPSYRVFDTSIAPSILITSVVNEDSPKLMEFHGKGVEIILVRGEDDHILDLREAFTRLEREYGIKRVLVEGGGFLLGTLLRQRLIDEIYLSISPRILGLDKVDLINVVLERVLELRLLHVHVDHVSGEVILVYRPVYD